MKYIIWVQLILFFVLHRNAFSQNIGETKKSTLLLENNCISNGTGELNEGTDKLSINRKIFYSLFSISTYSYKEPFLLTCQIDRSKNSNTLEVLLGTKDYAMGLTGSAMKVKIYMDGIEQQLFSLTSGNEIKMLLDISKSSSVAFEVICSPESFENPSFFCNTSAFELEVYFGKANIYAEPISSFAQTNFNEPT